MNSYFRYHRHILASFSLLIAAATLTACINYPRFTFGRMDSEHSCVAVFPFTFVDQPNLQDDLVSQYLALALVNTGFKATMGPREVKALFSAAGVEFPKHLEQREAMRLGLQMTADGVIYGRVTKFTMMDKENTATNPSILLGIDLYLLDLLGDSISWIYSTRIYTNKNDFLADLGKLSKDIANTLLTSGASLSIESKDQCWDKSKIALNLKKSGQRLAAAPKKAAKPKKVQLKDKQAKEFYQRLQSGKAITMRGLYEGRSSQPGVNTQTRIRALAKALAAFPKEKKFELQGHVDATDNSSDDFWVSAQQIGKLRDQLIRLWPALKGRIKLSAKGGASPLLPNVNKKSRKLNQRIQVLLLSR